MPVLLDRKALKPALVQVTGPRSVTKGVPALGMRVSKASQEARQFAVGFRPQDKVPMVGHDAIAKNSGTMAFQGVVNHPLERRKVLGSIE